MAQGIRTKIADLFRLSRQDEEVHLYYVAAIENLEKKLAAQTDQLEELQKQSTMTSALQKKVEELEKQTMKTVFVGINDTYINDGYIPIGTITYDRDDLGTTSNGFSPSSGVFNAGQAGHYLFLFSGVSGPKSSTADDRVYIRINGNVGKAISVPRHDGKWQEVTAFFGCDLQVGDKVDATNLSSDTLWCGSSHPITFVGMQIS